MPFSVKMYAGIPGGIFQAYRNFHAKYVAVIRAVGTAAVTLEYLTMMLVMCSFPFVFFSGGDKMYTTLNSSRPGADNN